MWFEYDQSNPGGSYDSSMPNKVFVEGKTAEEANDRAESVGVYFDGVDKGMDCSCCDDRWSRPWGDGEDSVFSRYWPGEGNIESTKVTPDDPEGMKQYFGQSFIIDRQYQIKVVPLEGETKTYNYDAGSLKEEREAEKRKAAEKLWGIRLFNNTTAGPIIRYFQREANDTLGLQWWAEDGNNSLYGKGVGFNNADKGSFVKSATFGSKTKKEVQAVQNYWKAMRTHMVDALKEFPASTAQEKKAKAQFIKVVS